MSATVERTIGWAGRRDEPVVRIPASWSWPDYRPGRRVRLTMGDGGRVIMEPVEEQAVD